MTNEEVLKFLRGPECRYRNEPFASIEEVQTQVVDKMNELALDNCEIQNEFYTIAIVKYGLQKYRYIRCNNTGCGFKVVFSCEGFITEPKELKFKSIEKTFHCMDSHSKTTNVETYEEIN